MAISANGAFAGRHECGSRAFCVQFFTAPELRPWQTRPRGHASYLKAGWYWYALPCDDLRDARGRFTSSRKAYQNAMAALAGSRKPIAA